MAKSLVLLSGPIAVGKSAVAKALINDHSFLSIRSGAYLRELATNQGKGHSRAELQELGDELDHMTDYAWLIDDVVVSVWRAAPDQDRWLLDSVRKARQVAHFRERYGPAIVHVHFTAPEHVLRARYEDRITNGGEYTGNTPYSAAVSHPNEISARSLSKISNLTIDLHQTAPAQAAFAIAAKCDERARLCAEL